MASATVSRASDPIWQTLLIESLMDLPDADGVSAATLASAWRDARLRVQLLTELRPLSDESVQLRLGISATELERWASTGLVLRVDRDGQWLYPRFQFDDDGRPLAEIAPILEALRPMSGWDIAIWFTARSDSLGDRRPLDIFPGSGAELVVAARQDADHSAPL